MGINALDEFAAQMAQISAKPDAEQAPAVKKAVNSLPKEQKEVISQALEGTFPRPDSNTSNTI